MLRRSAVIDIAPGEHGLRGRAWAEIEDMQQRESRGPPVVELAGIHCLRISVSPSAIGGTSPLESADPAAKGEHYWGDAATIPPTEAISAVSVRALLPRVSRLRSLGASRGDIRRIKSSEQRTSAATAVRKTISGWIAA
ncbi:uncharacterized protein FIBRA_05443 [Fibroporia radiculosa]|uniref:Uncharacterized protein n=1 Tax=Fibroporia radiculosa TaxID=599839 RepID=J4GR08_9APHY|nr:uncharacterized protein FIBRA_05443 [Fibroporia radiculosa]CCM03315.1 predicted protein [Fibroporia radiculosa]